MVIRKIGIMNWWLQQKIDIAQIVEIGTDPILDWYNSTKLNHTPSVVYDLNRRPRVCSNYSSDVLFALTRAIKTASFVDRSFKDISSFLPTPLINSND